MKTNEIFENLVKIEPKVVSIETLFNNEDTLRNTKYDPDYQRNYVWDDDKATYFIESILLGTEIPPIIYFRNGDKIEIIDGRQRYQTILRFIKNDFKLKNSGLHKLDKLEISAKYFKDLGDLRDDFWDTKLRIIEFSFHTKVEDMEEKEDIVKKEIFKRYNSGITPLKPTEIAKAVYFDDDLNSFLESKLTSDNVLFGEIKDLFYFEQTNIQILLKKIRQLLVQHQIPIKYYAVKKDIIISKYYELMSDKITEDLFDTTFSSFITKINILKRLKSAISKNKFFFNRLVSECVFWALSILEENTEFINKIDDKFISSLALYIEQNKNSFTMNRSSFGKELQKRYRVTADFFEKQSKISFSDYLDTTSEFKKANMEVSKVNKSDSKKENETSFDDLRINKPEPSSITIVDICRQMERQRFLIRPPYQRCEVKNRNKSSAIIESILLGIKLPPIFVYKRSDGVSEVLDGQQRLLSILGFLKKEYLDENNVKQHSNKNGYSLSLKNGILSNLNGKNVEELTADQVKKINNFDLWIIEINHRYNKDFEPIDLFLRLNSKPYPIKENSFEMWNSYIHKEIITTIKTIASVNKNWFYFRKNNERMENENIFIALMYLQYHEKNKNTLPNHPLEHYKIGNKINFRIRSKTDITKFLEDSKNTQNILDACSDLTASFIEKVKLIVTDNKPNDYHQLNKNLEQIFNVSVTGRRSQHSFYALWHFISKLNKNHIVKNKLEIRKDLNKLFNLMGDVKTKEDFTKEINNFWKKYKD
ncbi:MAG: DUF262 domain-containing protein [Bacteroidales bacterium]|nr:DUF262 domain-containing protein [Bacteroidales bacterium]